MGGGGRIDVHGTEHISKYRSLVPHGGRTSVFAGIAEGDVQCGHPDSWAECSCLSLLESTSALQTAQTRGWRHRAQRAPRETARYLLP